MPPPTPPIPPDRAVRRTSQRPQPHAPPDWMQANQQHLSDALARVRAYLQQYIEANALPATTKTAVNAAPASPKSESGRSTRRQADTPKAAHMTEAAAARDEQVPPPALDALIAALNLSPFERDIVVLCAGVELDGSFAALCGQAQGDAERAFPTFGLSLSCLPAAHWDALAPHAALRQWKLIETEAGSALTQGRLRLDERILHFLTGTGCMDERLQMLLCPAPPVPVLAPSHRQIAAQIAALWQQAEEEQPPLALLCGNESAAKRDIAAQAAAQSGLRLYVLMAEALPQTLSELETLCRLWERECLLAPLALLLDGDAETPNPAHADAVTWLADRMNGAFALAFAERRAMRRRPLIAFDVQRPTLPEQNDLWREALRPLLPASKTSQSTIEQPALAELSAHLSAQFDVSAPAIAAACLAAAAHKTIAANKKEAESPPAACRPPSLPPDTLLTAVWDACRDNARPRLDDLAQRIAPAADWDTLILPPAQRDVLADIAAHVRHRSVVYQQWGFAGQGARGLGISALFAGPSGTGKTTAAEALARELRLDLYRIDLSGVVSKYIGESEKNLKRVFDAAEAGGVILLFDEADALFGKRSEVKDSHDRYANLEVSYLLQRMEAYRGLAILTTNLQSALDTAFLRRIRFTVQFPFPDAVQRQEIWRRVFPPPAPTLGLDARLLAQMDITGGSIRSIALNAAFAAADTGEPIQMRHIRRAAQSEYSKLGKRLTEAETFGWSE